MLKNNNLLVSCVGAYHDSGIGTGGLVGVFNNQVVVIDNTDTTGLYVYKELYYRFIRSNKALLVYDENGNVKILFLREVSDAHDILVNENQIICVSTLSNEILFYDHSGKLVERLKFKGDQDAWHLNCLFEMDGRIFISAFGEFEEHRGWNTDGCRENGFIMDIRSGEVVVRGLSGPHNPRFYEGKWLVCDSHKQSLAVFENGERKDFSLGGFTRGINFDGNYFYVGVSADRKATTGNDHSRIVVLDKNSFQLVGEIAIPFPEIYDLIFVSPVFAENCKNQKANFSFEWGGESRVMHLENQVKLGELEISKLNLELGKLKADFETKYWGEKTVLEKIALRINKLFGINKK